MQIKWKKILGKTIVWLAAEIYLNFLGLDNLADYDEFINLSFTVRHGSLVGAIAPSSLNNTKQGKQNQWIFSIN